MERVLIAGCGYVGIAAARLFLARKIGVEAWTRSGTLPEAMPDVICRGVDLGDWKQVEATKGEFDFVVHSASTRGGDADDYRRLYFEGARNLKRRFRSSTFIFVSSTSVYAQRDGEWVDENSPADPIHERGKILRAAEDFVVGADGCVARFAGVYGPGRSVLLRRVLDNEVPRNSQSDRYINQIHRDDAASALLALAENGKAGQGIWNVADDQPLLLSECYRWLGERLQRELRETERLPAAGKRGNSNKRIKNGKLRGIGWNPTFPSFKEGAERTLLSSL